MAPDTTRQAMLLALQKSPLKHRRVIIDTHKLAVASKADCRKAAEEIEAALNDVPYFEIGEGYAANVANNVRDDTCLTWQERIESGWDALRKELGAAQSRADALEGLYNAAQTETRMMRRAFDQERQLVNDLTEFRARDTARWLDEKQQLEAEIARLRTELELQRPVAPMVIDL